AYIWAYIDETYMPIIFWMIVWISVLVLQFFIAITEREEWGVRITRTIPQSPPMKVLAFLFYSGAAGGLLFGLLLALATGVMGFLHMEFYGRAWDEWRDMDETIHVIWLLLMYSFCFTASAVVVRNLFIGKKNAR